MVVLCLYQGVCPDSPPDTQQRVLEFFDRHLR